MVEGGTPQWWDHTRGTGSLVSDDCFLLDLEQFQKYVLTDPWQAELARNPKLEALAPVVVPSDAYPTDVPSRPADVLVRTAVRNTARAGARSFDVARVVRYAAV